MVSTDKRLLKRKAFSISNWLMSPRCLLANALGEVGNKVTCEPTAYTSPMAERTPPPFLIEIATAGSSLRAIHKFASAVTLPKFVSSVRTKFRRPSRNTDDLPNKLPSLATITACIASQRAFTRAPMPLLFAKAAAVEPHTRATPAESVAYAPLIWLFNALVSTTPVDENGTCKRPK